MTRNSLTMAAAIGSAALLIGAWGFQYFGYPPCKMCLWQRWPHGAAILIAFAAPLVPRLPLAYLGAIAALTTAGIGIYHSGVERGWWEGPSSCSSGDISGLTTDELMAQIMAAPLVRCDEVAWEMLGLSMASWNAIFSIGLAVIWVMAARKQP